MARGGPSKVIPADRIGTEEDEPPGPPEDNKSQTPPIRNASTKKLKEMRDTVQNVPDSEASLVVITDELDRREAVEAEKAAKAEAAKAEKAEKTAKAEKVEAEKAKEEVEVTSSNAESALKKVEKVFDRAAKAGISDFTQFANEWKGKGRKLNTHLDTIPKKEHDKFRAAVEEKLESLGEAVKADAEAQDDAAEHDALLKETSSEELREELKGLRDELESEDEDLEDEDITRINADIGKLADELSRRENEEADADEVKVDEGLDISPEETDEDRKQRLASAGAGTGVGAEEGLSQVDELAVDAGKDDETGKAEEAAKAATGAKAEKRDEGVSGPLSPEAKKEIGNVDGELKKIKGAKDQIAYLTKEITRHHNNEELDEDLKTEVKGYLQEKLSPLFMAQEAKKPRELSREKKLEQQRDKLLDERGGLGDDKTLTPDQARERRRAIDTQLKDIKKDLLPKIVTSSEDMPETDEKREARLERKRQEPEKEQQEKTANAWDRTIGSIDDYLGTGAGKADEEMRPASELLAQAKLDLIVANETERPKLHTMWGEKLHEVAADIKKETKKAEAVLKDAGIGKNDRKNLENGLSAITKERGRIANRVSGGGLSKEEAKLPRAELTAQLSDIKEKFKVLDAYEASLSKLDERAAKAELEAAAALRWKPAHENKLKNEIVASHGIKASEKLGEMKEALRRAQLIIKRNAEEDALNYKVPEGTTVDVDGKQVPVKSLAEAEDADDVATHFRHKFENHPEYDRVFKNLVTDRTKTTMKFKDALNKVERGLIETQKKIEKSEANSAKQFEIQRELAGKTDEASKKASSSAKSSQSASDHNLKEHKENLKEFKKLEKMLKTLEEEGISHSPTGTWALDDDGRMVTVNRTVNQQIQNLASGLLTIGKEEGLPLSLFLSQHGQRDEEKWKVYDKASKAYDKKVKEGLEKFREKEKYLEESEDKIDTKKVSKLDTQLEKLTKETKELESDLLAVHRDLGGGGELWRKEFEQVATAEKAFGKSPEEARKVATDFLKELRNAWPTKLTQGSRKTKGDGLIPQMPAGGFFAAGMTDPKETPEEFMELHKELDKAGIKVSSKKLGEELRKEVDATVAVSKKGEETFADWYGRHTYGESEEAEEIFSKLEKLNSALKAEQKRFRYDPLKEDPGPVPELLRPIEKKFKEDREPLIAKLGAITGETKKYLHDEAGIKEWEALQNVLEEGKDARKELSNLPKQLEAAQEGYRGSEEFKTDNLRERIAKLQKIKNEYKATRGELTSKLKEIPWEGKKRIPGIKDKDGKDIAFNTPEYKSAARKEYDHYRIGEGRTDPEFGVKNNALDQGKKDFIKNMRNTFKSRNLPKNVLSDKYLGNLFDKTISKRLSDIEEQRQRDLEKEEMGDVLSGSATLREASQRKRRTVHKEAVNEFVSSKKGKKLDTLLQDFISLSKVNVAGKTGQTFKRSVSPDAKKNKELEAELERFGSSPNRQAYAEAKKRAEESGESVDITLGVDEIDRGNMKHALWNAVHSLADTGKEEASKNLATQLTGAGINQPLTMKKERAAKVQGEKRYLNADTLEARARAFATGGSYRDSYFTPEGNLAWKEFKDIEGEDALIGKVAKKYGIERDDLHELIPSYEDPSYTSEQHAHVVAGLKKLLTEPVSGSEKEKKAAFANRVSAFLQEHRDLHHPYLRDSILDLADVDSEIEFPRKMAERVLGIEKKKEGEEDIDIAPSEESIKEKRRFAQTLLSDDEAKELYSALGPSILKQVRERTPKEAEEARKKAAQGASMDAQQLHSLKIDAAKRGTSKKARKLISNLYEKWIAHEDVKEYKENYRSTRQTPAERVLQATSDEYVELLRQAGGKAAKGEPKLTVADIKAAKKDLPAVREEFAAARMALSEEDEASREQRERGYNRNHKRRANRLLTQLGIDERNLLKSLMTRFGVDKYAAFEMLQTMGSSMTQPPLYLDKSLCKASFLSWPQSKRNYNNSFNRLRVGVGPEETFSSAEESEKEDEKKDEKKNERREREQKTEKSFSLYVSV